MTSVHAATAPPPSSAEGAISASSSARGMPEASRTERLIASGLFLLAFFYLCTFRCSTWVDLDEGIILQGAQRILTGQVLYRDFFSFFTPGSYYLLALMFRVFGDSYIVAHTMLAAVGAVFSPITYLLARRVCGREASLLVTGMMTVTAMPARFVVLHNWDSTLWTCLAVYSAIRFLESENVKWGVASASFTSLTILFEQSKGAGLLIGLSLGFLIIALNCKCSNIFRRGPMAALVLGLAWPFLMTFLYFSSQHALIAALKSWFWPLYHYSAANRVPYGYRNMSADAYHLIFETGSLGTRLVTRLVFSPDLWIPLLPLFGLALLVRLAMRSGRETLNNEDWKYYVLVSAAVSGLLLSVVIGRKDCFHFTFLQPIFFLIVAWLLNGRGIRKSFVTRAAPILGLCLTISSLAMGAQLLFRSQNGKVVSTRRGPITVPKDDGVISAIQANVAPGEEILVYPYQSAYYYFTQTYSPTRFEFYQPGMNTAEQLLEILAEFRAHPTRVVLFEPAFADHIRNGWPNTPASALASDPMAEYIRREYHNCFIADTSEGWHFEYMVRKDLACPQSSSLSP